MNATPIRFVSAGTMVNHPRYGECIVVASLNRDEMSNVAGFPPGVWITIMNGERNGETIAVYANTDVTIEMGN